MLKEVAIPDLEYIAENKSDSLDFIHREIGSTDSYFVSNQESHRVNTTCKFRVKGKIPEFWDAETGKINKSVVFEKDKLFTSVQVSLESKSSVFVVFNKTGDRNHIKKIVLNGTPVNGYYSLNGNNIEVCKSGKYRIEYSNERPKEFEMTAIPDLLELNGQWIVTFDKNWGSPGEVFFDTLVSWTERAEEGVKYHSGKGICEKQFVIDSSLLRANLKIYLNLGEINTNARGYINGKKVGTLLKDPYRIVISGYLYPDKNKLLIEGANTWPNRIMGDLNSNGVKNYPWSNSTSHYNKDSKLIKSGLIGPVLVQFLGTLDINN